MDNMQPDIARRLQRLEDREAIRELVGRYALAMDDKNAELVAAIFAEDAIFRWKDNKVRGKASGGNKVSGPLTTA